jgi:hypothetical protein
MQESSLEAEMTKKFQNPDQVPVSTVAASPWWNRILTYGRGTLATTATQQQCSSQTGSGNGVCGTGKFSQDFVELASKSEGRR